MRRLIDRIPGDRPLLSLVSRGYTDEPPGIAAYVEHVDDTPHADLSTSPLVDDFHVEAVLAEADELLRDGQPPGIAWFIVSNRELARLAAWSRAAQQRAGNPNGTLADRIEMFRRVVTFASATMRFVGAHPEGFGGEG